MRSGPNSARPRGGAGVVAVVLVALLLSQWSGWAHRIAHAPGSPSLAASALASSVALAEVEASGGRDGHGAPLAREHGHDHADDSFPSPEGEGSHSCVLLDAAALGDGPPAQARIALRPLPPPASPAPVSAVVRTLDCPAFAAARAPPLRLS